MLAEEEENDAGGAAEVQGPAAAGGRPSALAGDLDLVAGPRRGCEERGRNEDRAGEGSCL